MYNAFTATQKNGLRGIKSQMRSINSKYYNDQENRKIAEGRIYPGVGKWTDFEYVERKEMVF